MAQCLATTTSGHECDSKPVTGCPVSLCVHHLAEIYEFIRERQSANVRLKPSDDPVGLRRAAAAAMPGSVYYLRVGQLVKIGHTRDLANRMNAYPPDAELLAIEVGTEALEAQRHRQFATLLSHRREWFRPGLELLRHIDELATK